MKKVISVILVLTIILISLLSIPLPSNAIEITSRKYKIHDNIISRIVPGTSLDTFKSNINQKDSTQITIKQGTTTVNQGIVKTGMQATFTKGSDVEVYKLSVIGDINSDGLANIIDLSAIIRHYIGLTEFQLTEEEKLKSIEINDDDTINPIDISKLISYIVTSNSTYLEDDNETYESYTVGEEVSVGGENFYVIEASDSTQSTVTLLAKYNLNKAGTEQAPNAGDSETAVAFSSTRYWASAYAAYTDWSVENELDINTVRGEQEGDAIWKAKDYATRKGGTNGKLLTYSEVIKLPADIGFGRANRQPNGEHYLMYWLSSASRNSEDSVWYVCGPYDGCFYAENYNNAEKAGVRPVMTIDKSKVAEPIIPTYESYTVGEEVSVGGENFYVIEASDSLESTVTLLAKYNLNKAGTEQAPNASDSETAVAFSSTRYWASAYAAYTDWSVENQLDINTVRGEQQGDAIWKAKDYATRKGGIYGKLLTYSEVIKLPADIAFGKSNRQPNGDYYLMYWLSSASKDNENCVWYVCGPYDGCFYAGNYNNAEKAGVRPAITVDKSKVTKVN